MGSNHHPLDLIKAHFIVPPVIELRRACARMVCHRGGFFKCPAILEIGRDSRRPETVIADLGLDADRHAPPLNHRPGVRLRQRGARELVGAASDRAEQWPLGIVTQFRPVEICRQIIVEIMVAGHRMFLAALFAQPHPQPAVLRIDIRHAHPERRADAREAVDHEGDQRPIAQAGRRRHVYAVEQRARLGWIEYRSLAGFDDMRGAAHRAGRIDRHHLAGDQPVEQMPHGRELLLDRRSGDGARLPLDPSRDMERLDGRDRRDAGSAAPVEELAHGSGVGPPRVRVADLTREEFEEADFGAVAGSGDERGELGRGDRGELAHAPPSPS